MAHGESLLSFFCYPAICEFAVQQPMAANAYLWGYLAGRR